jgi:hypothetical protein
MKIENPSYLGPTPGIPPEQAADDDQDQKEEAHARHGPEGDLQRRLRLPPELRGGRVGGRDVADNRGQILHPEGALPLAVVPQGRGVLRGVDGEELLYLPRNGHVPVDAKDVLGRGVAVPGEVGESVDEELAHVAVALGPQGSRHLARGTV